MMSFLDEPMSGRGLFFWLTILAIAAGLILANGRSAPDIVPAIIRTPVVTQPPATNAPRPNSSSQEGSPTIFLLVDRRFSDGVENAFVSRSWRKPVPIAPSKPVAPALPTTPAVPYAVLGKQLQDGRWEVFLGLQGRTLIVKQGDTIDGSWRVDQISPPSMILVYLLTSEQRGLSIGEGS